MLNLLHKLLGIYFVWITTGVEEEYEWKKSDSYCFLADDYGCYMQVLQDFDSGERNCDGCKVACV